MLLFLCPLICGLLSWGWHVFFCLCDYVLVVPGVSVWLVCWLFLAFVSVVCSFVLFRCSLFLFGCVC